MRTSRLGTLKPNGREPTEFVQQLPHDSAMRAVRLQMAVQRPAHGTAPATGPAAALVE
jgi:hypothetical protein